MFKMPIEEEETTEVKNEAGYVTGIFSFFLYLSLPVFCAMVYVGNEHKDNCPMDLSIPRYLFFAGASGIIAVAIRVLMVIVWTNIRRKNNGVISDSATHPSLSMARPMIYLFLLFIIIWNLRASTHLFSEEPDFEDLLSTTFCHPIVYWFTFVLVLTFNLVFGAAFLIWILAMLAGIIYPRILNHSEDFYSVEPKLLPSTRSSLESGGEPIPFEASVLGLEPALLNLETRFESETPKISSNGKKVKKTEIVSLRKSGDSDSDTSSTISSTEDRNNASIVRFNSSVFLRRISTDDGGGSGGNLFEIFGSKMSDIRRNTIFESFEPDPQSSDITENGLVLVNKKLEDFSKRRNSEDLPGASQLRGLFQK